MASKKPHFVIKNKPQKLPYRYRNILTPKILKDVCRKVTGCTKYKVDFDNTGYNKGRLAIIKYRGVIIYVSFSETGKISGRNYFFQSFPTALTKYHSEKNPKKRICFYFLPWDGNIETDYFMFMYRLMATAGVKFLNPEVIRKKISPFSTVDDIIVNRNEIKNRNKSNTSTYITKSSEDSSEDITEIYGKTYGANKYETALLCLAISQLSTKVKLYQMREQTLSTLPKPVRDVISSLDNCEVIQTNQTIERKAFEDNDSLRSPRFNYNLHEKMGEKKCAFCKCEIKQLIAGAHIWPVSEIKKIPNLKWKEQKKYATDGDNGIWLCENHHKMLDKNLIRVSENGKLKYRKKLDKKTIEFIKETITITKIGKEIIVRKFVKYLKERNRLLPETDYVSL